MEDNKEDIENIFRERFSQQEAPVSPRVWDNIKKTLPKEGGKGAIGFVKKYFLYSIAGILVVGLIGWILGSTLTKEDGSKEVTEKTGIEQNKPNDETQRSLNSEIEKQNILADNRKIENSETENNSVANNTTLNSEKNNFQNKDSKTTSFDNKTKTNKNSGSNNNNNSTNSDNKGNARNTANARTVTDKRTENSRKNKTDGKDKTNNVSSINNQTNQNGTNNVNGNNDSGKVTAVNNKSNENKSDQNTDSNISNSKNDFPVENKTGKEETNSNFSKDTSGNTNLTNNDTGKPIQNNNLPSIVKDSKDKENEGTQNDLLSTIKNEDQKAKQEQTTVDNKTNKDSINSSNNNQLLSTNTSTISSADSVKNVVNDSTNTNTPDSVGTAKKEEKKKTDLPKRWSFDVLLSPMLTGATTKATDPNYQAIVDSKNKEGKNQFNFSAGGMVNYSILPRLSISTGIIYSGYSEKNKFKNSVTHDTIVYHNQSPDSLKTDTIKTSITKKYESTKVDHYSFLSVPIAVSYKIWRREKLSLSATVGAKVNLLLNGTTYTRNANNTDLTVISNNYNKVTLSYMASLSMEYKLKEKISLLIQPMANFKMSSVYGKSFYLAQKPYSYGVNIGLRFRF